MKRLLSILVATAGIAALGVVSYPYFTPSGSASDPESPLQVASAETYKLRSTQTAGTCAVVRGDQLTGGRSVLSVDAACSAVLPGVEKAKYWVDKDDGSVAFTENGIDPIVTFAIADGVAYESLDPAQPVISLDAEDAPAGEGEGE